MLDTDVLCAQNASLSRRRCDDEDIRRRRREETIIFEYRADEVGCFEEAATC